MCVENHVGCIISDGCIWMSGKVVEQLLSICSCVFGGFGFIGSNGIEGS